MVNLSAGHRRLPVKQGSFAPFLSKNCFLGCILKAELLQKPDQPYATLPGMKLLFLISLAPFLSAAPEDLALPVQEGTRCELVGL